MKGQVFFAKEGEKGLNLTSAAHLCAIASQIKAQDEAKLKNISFITTHISVVGSKESNLTNVGYTQDNLKELPVILANVSRMNEFISWFAEARKCLEDYKKERACIPLYKWAEEKGYVLPETPRRTDDIAFPTLEDVIDEMDVKERQRYLALEARAAVLGKFIHPDQPYETARSMMHTITNKPYETEGNGRDTIIYHHEASVDTKEVDNLFNELQQDYRRVSQELNHMKADLRKKLDAKTLECTIKRQEDALKYKEELDAYNNEYRKYNIEFDQWQKDEQTRLSKIKLAIPNALAETVDYLNHLAG